MSSTRAAPELGAGLTIAGAQAVTAESFRLAGVESPEADARALICAALHLTRAQLIAQSSRILRADEVAAVTGFAARRLQREPVARILGEKEFWSLRLRISPDVLAPRPETETLVEAALHHIERAGRRAEMLTILDIGTGSGALLLALLHELPQARGLGVDLSPAALAIARANAEQLGLAERCSFVACDMAKPLTETFDLVVSNPPYIARGGIAALEPEVRDYDPILALDGGADGLDAYRAIAAEAPRLLRADGRLIIELGIGQEQSVRAMLTAAGLHVAEIRPDLAGIPRAIMAGLRETEP